MNSIYSHCSGKVTLGYDQANQIGVGYCKARIGQIIWVSHLQCRLNRLNVCWCDVSVNRLTKS